MGHSVPRHMEGIDCIEALLEKKYRLRTCDQDRLWTRRVFRAQFGIAVADCCPFPLPVY
jgi:hypothetical protein